MSPAPDSERRTRYLAVATVISLLVVFLLMRPFFNTLIAACVAAYVLVPVHRRLSQSANSARLAMPLTWLVGLVGFILPVALIVLLTAGQLSELVDQATSLVSTNGLADLTGETLLQSVNGFLASHSGGHWTLTMSEFQHAIQNVTAAVGSELLDLGSSLVVSFPRLVTNAIVFVYVVTGLIAGRKSLLSLLEQINPLGKRATEMYIEKADSMTGAMIKGQFVIALVQGLASALSLQVVGVGYFGFFLLLLSFLSLIPLGAGIVTIPIAVVLMLTGNVLGGLFVILTHFLVITNIDNVLRPRLVPREAELSPALTMIAVLSGVALFGFFGIVVGPVLFILAVTTIQVYADLVGEEPASG